MFLQIVGSFFAVVAFCYVLGAPPKFRIHAGAIGALGWALFLILRDYYDFSIGPATFFAGCLICTCAQILARILKTPVTIFIVTGILPLVPGAGMYRIAHSAMLGDSGLTTHYLAETLTTAGMLAVSIIVVDSVFRILPFKHSAKDSSARATDSSARD